MRFKILSVALLLAGAAVARDINVLCVPDDSGVFANTFSGHGKLSFEDETELPNANANMTLVLETRENKKTVMHDFIGSIDILKAGDVASLESYLVDMTSKDGGIIVKMFLNGPKDQSKDRVFHKGIEFRSSCERLQEN